MSLRIIKEITVRKFLENSYVPSFVKIPQSSQKDHGQRLLEMGIEQVCHPVTLLENSGELKGTYGLKHSKCPENAYKIPTIVSSSQNE